SESAADLIVDSATRHLEERPLYDEEGILHAAARPVAQQEVERHRLRKLRRSLEPAMLLVVTIGERAVHAVQELGGQRTGAARLLGRRDIHLTDALRGARHIAGLVAIRVGHGGENAAKRRNAMPIYR